MEGRISSYFLGRHLGKVPCPTAKAALFVLEGVLQDTNQGLSDKLR